MAYTKDYYRILQLPAPGWSSKQQTTPAELRRAYKVALLAAHPDKASAATAATAKTKTAYTVDDVKEAYTTLVNGTTKTKYENWFLHHRDTLASTTTTHADTQPSTDFILGLEMLDLGDFDVWESEDASTAGDVHVSGQEKRKEQMAWTRACRCGADKGFSISEEELGDAEARGEKEVLVGCVGCSLWVRVAFDVEVG